MNWLKDNYGWKAKRREYIWLAIVLAVLVVAAVGAGLGLFENLTD